MCRRCCSKACGRIHRDSAETIGKDHHRYVALCDINVVHYSVIHKFILKSAKRTIEALELCKLICFFRTLRDDDIRRSTTQALIDGECALMKSMIHQPYLLASRSPGSMEIGAYRCHITDPRPILSSGRRSFPLCSTATISRPPLNHRQSSTCLRSPAVCKVLARQSGLHGTKSNF